MKQLIFITIFFGLSVQIIFCQNNTIPTNGKVGIGTLTPEGKALNVVGTSTIGPTDDLNNAWSLIGTPTLGIGIDDNQITQAGDHLYLGAKSGTIRFKTLTFDRGVVDESGNFGFGTINPVGRVEIRSVGTLAGLFQPSKSYLNITDGTNSMLIDPNEFVGSGQLYFASTTGDVAIFKTIQRPGSFDIMTIKSNGSVAIGTKTTGNHRLAVEGSIGAREVNVSLNSWPDYVFRDNYDLISLDDLEEFINAHQHLPEVPSEQDVLAVGIDVGEMNALLLKKIEELSLYLIQEHELNKDLLNRIEIIESKLND